VFGGLVLGTLLSQVEEQARGSVEIRPSASLRNRNGYFRLNANRVIWPAVTSRRSATSRCGPRALVCVQPETVDLR